MKRKYKRRPLKQEPAEILVKMQNKLHTLLLELKPEGKLTLLDIRQLQLRKAKDLLSMPQPVYLRVNGEWSDPSWVSFLNGLAKDVYVTMVWPMNTRKAYLSPKRLWVRSIKNNDIVCIGLRKFHLVDGRVEEILIDT